MHSQVIQIHRVHCVTTKPPRTRSPDSTRIRLIASLMSEVRTQEWKAYKRLRILEVQVALLPAKLCLISDFKPHEYIQEIDEFLFPYYQTCTCATLIEYQIC